MGNDTLPGSDLSELEKRMSHQLDALMYIGIAEAPPDPSRVTATQVAEQLRRHQDKLAMHAMMYGVGTPTGRIPQQNPAWHAHPSQMQALFRDQLQRQQARAEVIAEYNKLMESASGPENSRVRGLFASWWAAYRIGSDNPSPYPRSSTVSRRNIYSDDPMERAKMIAEVRVGFAKCVTAARLRAERIAQRKRQKETGRE